MCQAPAGVYPRGRTAAPVHNWLQVAHGIHGRPIGLHVDIVNERLRRQRVDDWLEDMIDHLTPPYPVVPKKPPNP